MPGIPIRVDKHVLRTEGVIVESVLGQALERRDDITPLRPWPTSIARHSRVNRSITVSELREQRVQRDRLRHQQGSDAALISMFLGLGQFRGPLVQPAPIER